MERDAYGRRVPQEISQSQWSGKEAPYYYGLFPYIRERFKGTKGIAWYGFEDGLWSALFIDWGDERDLNR